MGIRLLMIEGCICKPIVLLLILRAIGLWRYPIAQLHEDNFICRLCLSIGLWIFYRTCDVLDA